VHKKKHQQPQHHQQQRILARLVMKYVKMYGGIVVTPSSRVATVDPMDIAFARKMCMERNTVSKSRVVMARTATLMMIVKTVTFVPVPLAAVVLCA
jgi:hypothetical protein